MPAADHAGTAGAVEIPYSGAKTGSVLETADAGIAAGAVAVEIEGSAELLGVPVVEEGTVLSGRMDLRSLRGLG